MAQFLAIDIGSQSVRALIFNKKGDLLYRTKIDIEPYFAKREGWAEQEPEYYWQQMAAACQGLWQQGAVPSEVAALAITTQRGTMVFLDGDGKVLRPAITWMDEREQHELKPMPIWWQLLITLGGKRKILQYARSRAQSNWVAMNQPEIWRRTSKYLQLSGFLNYKLTGEYKDARASQVGYFPYDYKKCDFAASWLWQWPAYHLKREQLPELVGSGDVIGHLTAAAAAVLGLPAGLKVIAAGADKACELIGAGLLSENIACLSYGTRATINTHSRCYREALKNMPSYTAAMPNWFALEVAVPRGFWLVSWFKKEFGRREVKRAKKLGVEAEVLFEKLLKDVPPGSGGLILQPYWGHEVNADPWSRGAIIGFGESHTRAHMYRAILEGIALALREGKDAIEKSGAEKITRLRVSGGGSQSDIALQITADVFNLPAERTHTFETSGLGAAIICAVGLGIYADYQQAMSAMCKQSQVFYPNPQNHALYNDMYERVYKRLYAKLSPLYKTLHQLLNGE